MQQRKGLKLLNNPVVADPLFSDAANCDFALYENSPALEIGFTPWNYDSAGTLEGTTVGTSHRGGETGYNDGAQISEFVSCRAKNLFDHIRDFYAYIANIISAYFNRLVLQFGR